MFFVRRPLLLPPRAWRSLAKTAASELILRLLNSVALTFTVSAARSFADPVSSRRDLPHPALAAEHLWTARSWRSADSTASASERNCSVATAKLRQHSRSQHPLDAAVRPFPLRLRGASHGSINGRRCAQNLTVPAHRRVVEDSLSAPSLDAQRLARYRLVALHVVLSPR